MRIHAETRRWPRFELQWTARLSGAGGPPTIAQTRNLSSGGIYLIAPRPFCEGERLRCVVEFPPHLFGAESGLALRCTARVLRVQAAGDGNFGIACRIDEYETELAG